MSRNSQLIKNTLIIGAGKISTQFITFLLLPLYTSNLTTSEFGTAELVITYVTLLTPLLTISLDMAAFRFLIDVRGNFKGIAAVITNTFQIVSSSITLFLVCFLVFNYIFKFPYAVPLCFAVVATVFSNLLLQISRGLGSNLHFSIGALVAGITTILVNVVCIIFLGWGAEAMIFAMAAANLVASLYLLAVLKIHRYIRLNTKDAALKKRLLRYSIPLVPNTVSWWIINAADRTLIALFLDTSSVGIYSVAYRFPLIFNGLFSFFNMSWTESASMNINSPDRDEFYSKTMNSALKVSASFGILIIASVPLVFDIIVDKSFSEAVYFIPILLIGAFLNSIVSLYGAILVAMKTTTKVMTTALASAVIAISFTTAFIGVIGLYAAALSSCVAFSIMAIYRHYTLRKEIPIRYEKYLALKLLFPTTIVVSLYYSGNTALQLVAMGVALIAALLLNWSLVKLILKKINFFLRRRYSSSKENQVRPSDSGR